MFKKALLPLSIVLLGVFSITMLVVAKPKPTPKPQEKQAGNAQVSVVEASPQSIKLAVTTHGTVKPQREIDVVAQVSGQVVDVSPAFRDGSFFERAQMLIQIDDRDYQIALLTAQAKLAEAKRFLAEEEGLSRQAKREWRDLGNQSANDLFIRKPQLAAAKANLAAAQGQVDMAKLNISRTKITVPFNGRVKQTFADLGQFVGQGSRLATVYDSAAVEVRLALTEAQAALVNLPFTSVNQQRHNSELPSVNIKGVVAGKTQNWDGRLTRTDAFVDSQSRMYYAVVEVLDPFDANVDKGASLPLLPGLFVEATIEGRMLDDVIVLPRKALYKRDTVVVLDSESKITHQKVTVLRKTADQVWVQADLGGRTLISLEKQSLIPEGTLVEPVLETSEAAKDKSIAQANDHIIEIKE